jgi:hypothetical protein
MLNGAAVAWKSKLQSLVALSSAEAEFMAASAFKLVQEVIYAHDAVKAGVLKLVPVTSVDNVADLLTK